MNDRNYFGKYNFARFIKHKIINKYKINVKKNTFKL